MFSFQNVYLFLFRKFTPKCNCIYAMLNPNLLEQIIFIFNEYFCALPQAHAERCPKYMPQDIYIPGFYANLSRKHHRSKTPPLLSVEQIRRRKFRTSDSYLHIRLYACPFLAKTRLYRSRGYIAVVLAAFKIQPNIGNGRCLRPIATRVNVYMYTTYRKPTYRAALRNISLLLPMFFFYLAGSTVPSFSTRPILERSSYIRKNPSGI